MERTAHWPEKPQEEALDALREIDFEIGPETTRQLDEARAQTRLGESISYEHLIYRGVWFARPEINLWLRRPS